MRNEIQEIYTGVSFVMCIFMVGLLYAATRELVEMRSDHSIYD